jgi:uncharacterized protein (TIRG00374 family)
MLTLDRTSLPTEDTPPTSGLGSDAASAHRIRASWQITIVLACAFASAGVVAVTASDDSVSDVVSALGTAWDSAVRAAARVSWVMLAVLSVVSIFHYLAAAAASRAAAGVAVPGRELVAAQLAASAANRVTPGGLGGAGVIGRYFTRRGGLTVAQSAAAVSSLAALGGLADVAAFAALVGASVVFGVTGAAAEVPHLLGQLLALVPFMTNPWVLVAGVTALAWAATIAALAWRRNRSVVARSATAINRFGSAVGALLRHPRRLAVLMGASAGTTLLLAAGFAVSAVVGPTHLSASAVVPLMIGYMVAAAAGNALPTPGGIGSADAAFVGVLVAAHASAGAALATVITFRVITFWAPAAIGVVMTRQLRRAGAL